LSCSRGTCKERKQQKKRENKKRREKNLVVVDFLLLFVRPVITVFIFFGIPASLHLLRVRWRTTEKDKTKN
jgi:hypothetical protein